MTLTFPLRDNEGDVFGICGTSTDITERVEARARLEMFSYAMDIATDGICIFERDGNEWRISYANQMFETMTGYSAAELYGFTSDFLMDGAQDNLAESRAALLRGEDIRTRRYMRRKDGTTFWTAANGRPMMDDSGTVTHSIVLYRDITEDVVREHKLSHEASHDPLTGVYNRRFALDALDAALAECRREDTHHTLVVFDLDEFKPVNDRHGHEAGDKLLTELTAAVSARVRAHDTFARMGGDEFCVLFRECSDVRSMGNEILDAIGRVAVVWGGERLSVSASIGAVELTSAMGDAHAALRQADAACYAAKRGGKNRVVVA